MLERTMATKTSFKHWMQKSAGYSTSQPVSKILATSGAFGSVKRAGRKLSRKIGRGIDVRAFRKATA